MAAIKKPLVVLYGPTASGKTELALKIALKHQGEIIAADSRTIYKGMDIGTAKPSKKERALVPHHLLDILEPSETFTAYDFKERAQKVIGEITARHHLPILTGGTGLYIDSVVFDYSFAPVNATLREKLEQLSLEELYKYSKEHNIELPENQKNKRYVVRNIERNTRPISRKHQPIRSSIIVGIATKKEILKKRIVQRAEYIFENGVVEEAISLGEMYGWDAPGMTGNIYRLARSVYEGTASRDEVKQKFITLDWRLAKRQLTWLKRNPYITWLPADQVEPYIATSLARIEQK